MGSCEIKNNESEESKWHVNFVKDGSQYILPCSQREAMSDVIMRFCRQNNFTKRLYKFTHNNKPLNENFTYEQLTPINNTRIIYVQIDSRDHQLVNMENIITKINYPYI